MARERVRDAFGLTWSGFSAALAATPPGNDGRILLPWFDPEITPHVPVAGARRFDLDEADGPANVRAVVEAQMMSMAIHSAWMQGGAWPVSRIHATGGASTNREILRVMADVFGADVYQLEVANSACLGAALRARHAHAIADGRPLEWDDIIRGVVDPIATSRLQPDRGRHAMYKDLMRVYAAREAEALQRVQKSWLGPA